jgi:hypothetical protein
MFIVHTHSESNMRELAEKIILLLNEYPNVARVLYESNEPLRAIVDFARLMRLHTIEDGSDEYAALVDELEELY